MAGEKDRPAKPGDKNSSTVVVNTPPPGGNSAETVR
jgi:hypothetical protein